MMTPDRAEVLALVRSSPAYVAVHDKTGWIGIFGEGFVVEDPVGSRPVRSAEPGALMRFWDTFIAPNEIEFQVARDWVDGFDVVRDVTIVTTLRPGVIVRTPAHLIYQTAYEGGALSVRRMAAHWEPLPVYAQLARPTRAHLAAALGQFAHMFRTLGMVPALQFVAAARFVGLRRKQVLRADLRSRGITDIPKLIASGHTVTASCLIDGEPAAVFARFKPRSSTLLESMTYADLA